MKPIKEYLGYKCKRCKKELILITIERLNHRGYIVCPYCSGKTLELEKEYDDLRECLKGGEIDVTVLRWVNRKTKGKAIWRNKTEA